MARPTPSPKMRSLLSARGRRGRIPALPWALAAVSSFGACGPMDRAGEDVAAATSEQVSDVITLRPHRHDPKPGPASYLVALRRTASGSPGSQAKQSFALEQAVQSPHLGELTLGDQRVQSARFLLSLELPAVEAPTAQPGPIGAPYLQRLVAPQALVQDPPPALLAQVDFANEAAAAAALGEWKANRQIWFAEPNGVSQLFSEATLGTMANDYAKLNYWWVTAVHLPEALNALATRDLSAPGAMTDAQLNASPPVVAILDSGVDYLHPALKDRIWTNSDQNSANCIDDLHGCNTTASRGDRLGNGDVWPFGTSGPGQKCPQDDPNCTHGTHVAGLIAGDYRADSTVTPFIAAGVCPVCKIMILRIVGETGGEAGILDSSILAALKYVSLFRKDGRPLVRVINASFGKFTRSRAVGLMIRVLRERQGTIVIGAAGNEDTLTREYPAAFADAVAVAAVNGRLRKVAFSNFGPWVSIAAPGQLLISSIPGGGYEPKSGTSMAAPLVAGAAGLVLAKSPNLSFDDLRAALVQGADPKLYDATYDSGYNHEHFFPKVAGDPTRQPLLGTGLLDVQAAVNRSAHDGLPLSPGTRRVGPGCAVIAGNASQSLTASAWGLQGLGLLVLVVWSFRKSFRL